MYKNRVIFLDYSQVWSTHFLKHDQDGGTILTQLPQYHSTFYHFGTPAQRSKWSWEQS